MYTATISSTGNNNQRWFAVYSTIFLLLCYGLPAYVQADTESATVKQLSMELKQRDAIINNLLQRVEQLERRVGGTFDAQAKQQTPSPPTEPKIKTAKNEQPKDAKPSKPGGMGTFEVDEKSAERALERTLNIVGALLLPAWSVEIQPFFSYSRSERDLIQLLNRSVVLTDTNGNPVGGFNTEDQFSVKVANRQNNYNLGVSARVGLPYDSQLELSFPYRFVDATNESFILGLDRTDSASGAGDLSIGIAKTLLREKNWWPDLIGRITWDTATGSTEEAGILLGDGINELRFSFTALKRLDPLALFGTVAYQTAFERDNALFGNDFKPGDQYIISLGVSLATSPETSLSAAFQSTYSNKDEINGEKLFGSDQLASSLVFGASWIVGRGSLISFSPAIGLTDDAADFSANLSWSYRLR